MSAKNHVNRPILSRRPQRRKRICQPASHRMKLPNATRRRVWRCDTGTGQNDYLDHSVATGQRGQEIAIVLRDATVSPKCVGYQRENS
jgi:hypothetical protein